MNYTLEQLQEAFNQLPTDIKDYLLDDEVEQALETLTDWFEIDSDHEEGFRRAVLAMAVGLAKSDEFISYAKLELGFNDEDADVLFGEVGDRILEKLHDLFDKTNSAMNIGETSKTPQQPQTPQKSGSDIHRFVGIPAYGVQRPASSYTSVLPRSEVNINRLKDTPTAESFIQKLGNLGNENGAGAIVGTKTAAAPATPTAPVAPMPPVAPSPEPNLPVLKKSEPSIELAKLAGPVNIPHQEVTMETKEVAPASKPAAPSEYSIGTDPYRESPTP